MVAVLVMLSALGGAESAPHPHVRATESRIVSLVEKGIARSAGFRRLVDHLDASDVIVYLDPKTTHGALGGYLVHQMTVAGGMRYLHVVVDTKGAEDRLIPLIAHELQHAVEVADAQDVRDSEGLVRMFERLAVKFGCESGAGECFETKAARDVEAAVLHELKLAKQAPAVAARH
jgi:hypothetical protein